MIYVVTTSARTYNHFCRDRCIDSRDQSKVRCVSDLEHAHGFRPSRDDKVVMLFDGDIETFKYLQKRQGTDS